MHFRRGILPGLAIVFPPDHLEDLHATFGSGRGGIVFKYLWEELLDGLGIFIAEPCSFSELRVHAAEERIDAVVDPMLHAHGVGASLALNSLTPGVR